MTPTLEIVKSRLDAVLAVAGPCVRYAAPFTCFTDAKQPLTAKNAYCLPCKVHALGNGLEI